MRKIKTYQAEADIKELIQRTNTVASLCPIVEYGKLDDETKAQVVEAYKMGTDAQEKQFDLYYLKSILVTANSKQGNLNADWFLPEETWIARHTPEDKPFDNDHDHRQIIGHITANYVIDDAGEVVADDLELDVIPEKFHIVTSAVIYRHWKNADQAEKVEKLIEAIEAGKKYVSMEALFTNFDYAMEQADGSWNVVTREKSTAHLTKHLRCYGGTGEYQGKKVERALRNITFSGKGLVDRPGNPESVILESEAKTNFVGFNTPIFYDTKNILENSENYSQNLKNLVYSNSTGTINANPFHNIKVENNTVSVTSNKENIMDQVEALKAQVAELTEKLAKANVEAKEKTITTLEAKVTELEAALAEKSTKLTDAAAALEAATKDKEKAEKEKKDKEDAYSTLATELEQLKAVQKTQARVAAVEAKGKSHDEAVAFEKKYAKVDDETFASIVSDLVAETKVEAKKEEANASADLSEAEEVKEPETVVASANSDERAEMRKKAKLAIAGWFSPEQKS
jgi:chemotaxis protein histidine kinase CheA